VLLGGSVALVKERIAETWKAPPLAAGSNLGNAAEVINSKPVFALVVTMSQAARTEALADIKGPNLATDVIKRHKFSSFAVFRDGIGWTWIDSHKDGLEAMTQISEGMIEVLRAAQIAPRGFAKIAMGALESYRSTSKQIDDVIKRKSDIQKIVETYSGDGKFVAKVDKDPNKLKLTVRLTGKSLSEVVPAVLPFAVLGMLMRGEAGAPPPPAAIAAPPPPAPPPAKKPAPKKP
jgi:hypothetical protein